MKTPSKMMTISMKTAVQFCYWACLVTLEKIIWSAPSCAQVHHRAS